MSPYREAPRAPVDVQASLPRLRFKPGAAALTLAGSLAVHGVVLAASAWEMPPLGPTEIPVEGEVRARPARDDQPPNYYLVRPEPQPCGMPFCMGGCDRAPEAVQACFDREVVADLNYEMTRFEAAGYKAGQLATWTTFATTYRPEPPAPGNANEEWYDPWQDSPFHRCLVAARYAGWRGEGRVLIRVLRREDGTSIAQTWPLSAGAEDPGLLCCLREVQEYATTQQAPGTGSRFTVEFHDGEPEDGSILPPLAPPAAGARDF